MKVYLAWDDGDYYGPHPVGNLVYATSGGAAKAVDDEFHRGKHTRTKLTYKKLSDTVVTCNEGSYYIEEVEVGE